MELDPPLGKYQTSDPTSFAHTSARERWPTIITGAIDDVHRATGEIPNDQVEKIAQGKTIIEKLAKLKYELQHNRQLTKLEDDGVADIAAYNVELEARGFPAWHDVEWLYAECYLYRRIATILTLSIEWKNYDVFRRQKLSTFRSSRPAVLELAAKYRQIIEQLGKEKATEEDPAKIEEAEKLLFAEMAEICLWGNATDLSLLTTLKYEDIQKLQGSNARKESQKMILANDLAAAFKILRDGQKAGKSSDARVSIVLDNAGFELFVDLILAGYLLATGLASQVVLHPKSIPWFVSDVIPADFADLMTALTDPRSFFSASSGGEHANDQRPEEELSETEVADLNHLFAHWGGLHGEGELSIRPSRFWTQSGSYWRMPQTAPDVFEDLKESALVVFKGDLNYRKLTGDATWEPTTPFAKTLGPLGPGSGIRTLALRTCKADVVVGLPEGKDEELRRAPDGGGNSGARKWGWSGKWAVIQFCDGKA